MPRSLCKLTLSIILVATATVMAQSAQAGMIVLRNGELDIVDDFTIRTMSVPDGSEPAALDRKLSESAKDHGMSGATASSGGAPSAPAPGLLLESPYFPMPSSGVLVAEGHVSIKNPVPTGILRPPRV